MTVSCQVDHRGDFSSKQDISQRVHSRSTSPGSNHSELPEYDYPTPIFVRNTFLDTPVVRPLSLDEFVQERRIQSCPLEALGSPDSEAQEEAPVQRSSFSRAATLSSTALTAAANDAAFAASRAVSSFRDWWNPVEAISLPAGSLSPDSGHEAPTDVAGHNTSQVICLANALVEPELGSIELPTVGSAGHKWGACKPCAFLYKRGCQNGVQCSFCHLCDSGEKKRRQKEKIALLKEMRASA
jgi:hypothetical protein